MRIILATPIYPPQIGGPAQYVKNLSERLKEKEIENEIVSYNNLQKYPQPLKFFIYFFSLLREVKGSDIIYAFNLISCGLPAYLISKILNKKFIIRLGGDFLWEKAIEKRGVRKILKEYYQLPKGLGEKFWMFFIKKVLNGADKIIFNSNFQREIYLRHFGTKEEKIVVIENPFPEIKFNTKQETTNYQLLYAGRLIKLKNLDILIDVFERIIKQTDKPLTLKIIGQGPEKQNLEFRVKDLGLKGKIIIEGSISHQELLREIQRTYLCLLPSLTEISPNFALECIKLRKPILLTKETGIYEDFKDYLIFIEPENERDIEKKINYLLKRSNYRDYIKQIEGINVSWSWLNVVDKHLGVFRNLCSIG